MTIRLAYKDAYMVILEKNYTDINPPGILLALKS